MATFSQFFVAWQKEAKPKQFYWICGPERVLVEDIVSTIKDSLNLPHWNTVPVVLGTVKERVMWSEIEQYPIDNTARLVIVRNAEKIEDKGRVIRLLKERSAHPNTTVIFVAETETLPRIELEDNKTQLEDHIAVFSGQRGSAVECKPFTDATAKHALSWVLSKVTMRVGVAGHLLNRADGNLRLVRDIYTKLSFFDQEPTVATINEILAEQPRENFVDALLALDKKTALQALKRLDKSEYSKTLGLLDARLDFAGIVHDMLQERKDEKEIARAVGNKGFLVPAVSRVAKHYDKKRRINTRQVLRSVDENLQLGSTCGIMEAIVSEW